MKLILVRHGHTDDLKNNIVQGQRRTPLNLRGRREARLVALVIRKLRIHAINSSDLPRALQTAETIAKYHPRLTVKAVPALREKGHGIYEGSTAGGSDYLARKYYLPYEREKNTFCHNHGVRV